MLASLWIPGPLPGLNDLIAAAKGAGGRGRAYSVLKRDWTAVIKGIAHREKTPAFPGRVMLFFHWFEKDKRRDPDNVAAGGRKIVLDGLVAAGVLKGDGWRHVQVWQDRFDVAASVPLVRSPGVSVTIEHYAGATLMGSKT